MRDAFKVYIYTSCFINSSVSLGGLLLPNVSAIDRGATTAEQSSLLFSDAGAKTLHLFLKLRAQEELIYIKVVGRWKRMIHIEVLMLYY